MNFYNEIDPYCCDWLENLIQAKLIPDGVVDRRSIVDILPHELSKFTQCHFFAGLGGWPLALRRAAWPDHRPVWTGSCPCQPFSNAGKRIGFADDRHLWPWWRYLIAIRRPAIVFGEQVASAAAWLNLMRGDLEALEYALGFCPIEAASAGADHLRDRYWFVAHDEHAGEGRGRILRSGESAGQDAVRTSGQPAGPSHNGVAQGDARGARLAVRPLDPEFGGAVRNERAAAGAAGDRGNDLGDPGLAGTGRHGGSSFGAQAPFGSGGVFDGHFRNTFVASGSGAAGEHMAKSDFFFQGDGELQRGGQQCGTGGDQEAFDWVLGADGKARRVKSGIRLLAHGVPSRVAKLRAFGNAIDPRPAAAFIAASMEALDIRPNLSI